MRSETRLALVALLWIGCAACFPFCCAPGLEDLSPEQRAALEREREAEPLRFSGQLRAASLREMSLERLVEQMARLGWKEERCQSVGGEALLDDEEVLRDVCSFAKEGLGVEAERYEAAGEAAEEWAEEKVAQGMSAAWDHRHALALRVRDEKAAAEFRARLLAPLPGTLQALKTWLEGQELETGSCEARDGSLQCAFGSARIAGQIGYPAPAGLSADGGRDGGEPGVDLWLYDRQQGDRLLAELCPLGRAQSARARVRVQVGSLRSWDDYSDPDLYVVVDGDSYREQRCEDEHRCTLLIWQADPVEIEVWDADLTVDDFVGECECGPGQKCQAGPARVEIEALTPERPARPSESGER
ncbi:MAG: hypothetical protein JXR96_08435 [Deltaproteobacteria bacterium]|nr:hypothetical protein [Deltaproteobacteria bacterium]